ncbi:TetR/AcrR family transcriptional regulator [Nocardia rosealba]|uniref:TetR/AcrR family transcriptional regulator n=1 Tax=Nocardia rosealba TaxID=2878563 RepID=UPI001CD93A53|nr:TetR/AcrR family transcriptional regulator [Nocardia rosealba]MCA2209149.1 TetR/AcrR family transcriptional regulator [Nocardia rosealba]
MGAKGAETRCKLIRTTRSLIESRGYFGTGLKQIVEDSGAPRGSLYFHFPGGKDELISAALTDSGTEMAQLIRAIEAADAREFAHTMLRLLGDQLEASDWTIGCPVAAVALDTASTNDAVRQTCSDTYRLWEDAIRERLTAFGHPEPERLATASLALIEGGLVLARAHRDRRPLDQLADTIDLLV